MLRHVTTPPRKPALCNEVPCQNYYNRNINAKDSFQKKTENNLKPKDLLDKRDLVSYSLYHNHYKKLQLHNKQKRYWERSSQAGKKSIGDSRWHDKGFKSESVLLIPDTRLSKLRRQKRNKKKLNKNCLLMSAMEMTSQQLPLSCSPTHAANSAFSVGPLPVFSFINSERPNFGNSMSIKSILLKSSVSSLNTSRAYLYRNYFQSPTNLMKDKRRLFYERQRLPNNQINKLWKMSSSNSSLGTTSLYDQSWQSLRQSLPIPKTNNTPFPNTVEVYTACNISPNASFNVKFYRSMGDGRQMYENELPYESRQRDYSSTKIAKMKRDEDGCICIYIPQERPRCDRGPNCLKRCFRVLLKEQKRCLKPRPKSKLSSYGSCRPDCDMEYQCRYSNASSNFHSNDVSCQCTCKNRRQPRSDIDMFYRNRGTTCVTTSPGIQSNINQSNNDQSNYKQRNNDQSNDKQRNNDQRNNISDKNAVNIGSKFSFQIGFYRRYIDDRPLSTPSPGKNHSYNMPSYDPNPQSMQPVIYDRPYNAGSEVPEYREPNSGSMFNALLMRREANLQCNSCGSQSDEAITYSCNSPVGYICKSPASSWRQFVKSQFERNDICCNNLPKSHCKPKKEKKIKCRCNKTPKVVGCIDEQNGVDAKRSRSTISRNSSSRVKHRGCNCVNEPILVQCTKKKKSRCQCNLLVCDKTKLKNRNLECNLNKELISRNKNSNKDQNTRIIPEPQKESKNTSLKLQFAQMKNKMQNIFKKSKPLSEETPDCEKEENCTCDDSCVKKILSSQLFPRARKIKSKGEVEMNLKKKFCRLLLYNTVQKPASCCECKENSRSIGIGEEDYRKIPPCCCTYPTDDRGDGYALKKFVSKLVKPETCTTMHYSSYNPQCQCEAGVQHVGKIGRYDIAGTTICRNQGVECPRSKPLTTKDYEIANAKAAQQENERKRIRFGSNCSFCVELSKGAPPPQSPPTFTSSGAAPDPARSVETTTNRSVLVGDNCRSPVRTSTLAGRFTSTCQKCPKVPLIKRGFTQLILRDKKNRSTCQKTNTLKPVHRLTLRKPAGGAGSLAKSPKCDPYVCLQRINKR